MVKKKNQWILYKISLARNRVKVIFKDLKFLKNKSFLLKVLKLIEEESQCKRKRLDDRCGESIEAFEQKILLE